jgi:2,4-dienoyl-CoA reductase-like NADH-dependent reductase (Old Yellow Enzyme family)/thioredoxin reductase
MFEYPHLFQPLQIGDVVFRNRILAAPTGHTDIRADKTLGEDAILYYARTAQGGCAAVCIGECQIDLARGGRGGPMIDMGDPRSTTYLQKIADRVSRHGAVCSAELNHGGCYSASGLGPSVVDVDGRLSVEMTPEQISETIEAYAFAAAHAKMRGCRMVTIHGGHGWLPQQFFSRFTNRRTDEWGGSAENRARFAVAICDAVHARCGRGFPVEFRISATEFESGYGLDEGIEYALALDGHADIIHVSAAVHGTLSNDDWLRTSPGIFTEEGPLVPFAAEIKKRLTRSYVATVGSLTDPAMMEDIVASGHADFVAIARGLLADPDLPNKARSGRTEDIRQCLRCMYCWSNLMSGGMYCAINPETSREAETTHALPPAVKKRVLVAGGGIAGMQAALTAAENGHEVILAEASGELGGGIRCERDVPFKRHVDDYIAQQERLIHRAGVDVRLDTAVDAELVRETAADVLIAAIGSKPIVPQIEGILSSGAISAQDAFSDPDAVGRRAVIIGAGLVGCELGIYLDSLGRDVTIIELGADIGAGGNATHGLVVKRELRQRELEVRFLTRAVRVSPDEVECETPEGTRVFAADTVIYASGQSPLYGEAFALSQLTPYFHMLGDCNAVGNIGDAVKAAYTIARDIGRG